MATPFFLGSVIINGNKTIEYTLPDNIGKFEIRAYAISKDSKFGVASVEQISRKNISLIPSLPRIARTNDTFEGGVSILVETDYIGTINISLQSTCELLDVLDPNLEKTIEVNGKGTYDASYTFYAKNTGEAIIRFYLTTEDGNDALEQKLNILGAQEPVFIATSMAISNNQEIKEGYVLPDAVKYSGTIELDVGVGRLPAIQKISKNLIESAQYPYASAMDIIGTVYPYITLLPYGNISDPYKADFDLALQKLDSLTTYKLKMYPDEPIQSNFVNLYLHSFAIFTIKEVKKNVNVSNYKRMEDTWINALDTGIVDTATLCRYTLNATFSDFYLLSYIFLAMGTDWKPNTNDTLLLNDLSLNRLYDNLDILGNSGKSILALAHIYSNNNDSDIISLLLSQIEPNIRIQGRTAYISYGSGSPYSDRIASAITLLDFTLNKNETPIVEKLANYVALEENQMRYSWFGVEESSFSLLSLSAYDQWKENVNPDLTVHIKSSENETFLEGEFTSASDPTLHNKLYFEDSGEGRYLSFDSEGQGEASIVMGLNFVPLELSPDPIYRGIAVEKVLQLLDDATYQAIGAPLTNVKVGSKVKVTIQITIPDDSSSVTVVDPVPAGLEPLDEAFFNFEQEYYYYNNFYLYCFFNSFNHREYYKDKVIFQGNNLIAGTYTVSYVAISNVVGEFILPPTKAYDTRQPEVMGLSASGRLTTDTILNFANTTTPDNTICIPYNRTIASVIRRELSNSIQKKINNGSTQNLISLALMIISMLLFNI
jgi:uncharacterized protein YfaS (alpha-2-macroglobulin family)